MKKRFASVDEASMAVLDEKSTPHATRGMTKNDPASQEVTWHHKDLFEENRDLDATSKKLARGRTFMGP